MVSKQRYSAEQVIKALVETRGLIWPASRKLDCDPQTVRNYISRYPAVAQTVKEQRARLVDSAEIRLVEAVESKAEPWAIALVLKTLGKERGYVERTEQSGPDAKPLFEALQVVLSTPVRIEVVGDDDPFSA